tara:strand:- start:298 stop:789 length:492 start_codon:yes stop_codon:yes gene_type:complete
MNYLFITLFGIGNIKTAPGSFASFFTCIVIYILFHLVNLDKNIILLILIFIFLLSIIAIKIYTKNFINKDPQEIVIDEFIGQSIPLYLYEISHDRDKDEFEAIIFYIIIFVLFRFFDIIKPYPINIIDTKFKNTYGILLDDILAGVYTVITLILFMILKNIFT